MRQREDTTCEACGMSARASGEEGKWEFPLHSDRLPLYTFLQGLLLDMTMTVHNVRSEIMVRNTAEVKAVGSKTSWPWFPWL